MVLIDRQQPFGNEHLLPRGTLREPPSHLARAHTIFITKSDGQTEELRRRITALNPTAAVIECVHHPMYLEDVFTGERQSLDFIKGRKVGSFSGIAQPESFEQSLVQLGAELVYPSASPTITASASRKSSTPSIAARNARRNSSSPRRRTRCAFPSWTAATCQSCSCAWKSRLSAAPTTSAIACGRFVSADRHGRELSPTPPDSGARRELAGRRGDDHAALPGCARNIARAHHAASRRRSCANFGGSIRRWTK